MKKRINNIRFQQIVLLALTLLVAACSHQKSSNSIHFQRFEQELFETPFGQLQQHLVEVQPQYNTPLLNLQPQNPQFMEMLAGFVADPVVKDVYEITQKAFPSMEPYEAALAEPIAKMEQLIPGTSYKHFYTMVSCQFDYSHRVFCDDESVVVSIDQYALSEMESYSYFGSPLYLAALSQPQYLVCDILAAMARQRVAFTENEDVTLLDHIIAEGKVMYLLEQLLPKEADTLRLRYTEEQLRWMKSNEAQVWSYFIKNKLLYETDYMRYHNFIDEAPKTNAFRDSAPRTTVYIGWQIVRQYMKKNKQVSLAELFDNANAQEILSQSGYRP